MRPQSNNRDGNPDNEGGAEEKSSKDRFDVDFDLMKNTLMSNNNNKPPPPVPHQPATAAVNSIHWDVEEGMFCL